METEIITTLRLIFYDNYYKHFLLSNLENVDQLYISLSGSELDTSPAAKPNERIQIEDIQSRIMSTLSSTVTKATQQHKSYVVFGDGGSGKTTLALSIVNEYWKKFRADTNEQVIIPLYIHLPQLLRLRQYCRIKDILNLYILLHFSNFKQLKDDVTATDILKIVTSKYEILVVLDGYENFVDKRNLWEQNNFGELNLKTIAFCRPEALSDSEFDKVFSYRFEGAKHKAKYYFLLPLASVQISSYLLNVVEFLRNLDSTTVDSNEDLIQFNEPWLLTKEITKRNRIWERDSSEYRHWFQLILPELAEVSQTPFVLCLLCQVLPTIVEEYRLRPSQSSFDMELIQLISTEVGIYDQFTRRWFDYSSDKIIQIHPKLNKIQNFLPQLLEIYSNNLAVRLFNRKQGFVGDGKFSRKLTEEWDLWKPNENSRMDESLMEQIDTFSLLFPKSEEERNDEKLGHLLALRSGCLLRYFHFQSQGENYMFQFLHSTLLEYFVSRTIFKGLRAELKFHLKEIGVKSTEFSFSFESIRCDKYVGILHMLVERARIDSDFKSLLLSVVRGSKEISSLGMMSSNAFTILTQAFRVWCNEDFSYTNLADADMSHCIFTNCEFKGADMSRVLLTGTYFYKSHLQAANLYHSHMSRGLNFHLQKEIKSMDRKIIEQFHVFESEGNNKVKIIYRNEYGSGLSDLIVFDASKKESKMIVGSPQWSVLDYRSFQKYPNVFLVALQSCEKSQSGQREQTLAIFEMKKRLNLMHLDHDYLRKQRDKCQPLPRNLSIFFSDVDADGAENYTSQIFTIAIPNYDEKIVCYRNLPTEKEGQIIVTSFYFSLTTSAHPFSFSILSRQKISSCSFSLHQSSLNSTLLATSTNHFITLFELHEERVLFRKRFSPPQCEGQVVVTFIKFSPDGKFLLFDMGNTLYILALQDNAASIKPSSLSCKEVSLLGSKGGYDAMLCCDFSSVNSNQPLVALVYDHGTPLVINLETGQKLQSIKLWYNCRTLSFTGGGSNQLQLTCTSSYGSVSSQKIHFSHAGDPRSIQALNPRTDFHSLIDPNLEHAEIFVSYKGKYMAVVKHEKHHVARIGEEFYPNRKFWLLLFKIDGNSGKRTFVFDYTFNYLNLMDIQVFFVDETFVCLMYPNEFKVFKCEVPYLTDGKSGGPVSVQISFEVDISTHFQKSWYHEPSRQIILQQKDSVILELYSIEISSDKSYISLNVPRYRLDLGKDFGCSEVKIFFHVSQSDNFAYILPFSEWFCFIWNLNTGSVLNLSVNELERYKLEDVIHVSTVFVRNDLPAGILVDFSKDLSFVGVINRVNKTLELEKNAERHVYQSIEHTNYFLSFYKNSSFTFGTRPWSSFFALSPIHDVDGFKLIPVATDVMNNRSVRLLAWDKRSISCFEVDVSSMDVWKGDKQKFTGWRLLWCDPPNDQFSLLYSNTTNAVLGKDEDWDLLSKRFACKGKVSHCLHSFISLSSLFEQIHDNPRSIFSRNKDLTLSDDNWILFVIAKKNGISGSRLVNINVLQAHSGIIIEGIRNGRHFAFRADLFINSDKIYEITVAPLKRKKEKYLKLHQRYLAAEFEISSGSGHLIIEKILADKQSEIDYHLLYKNCNSWVKSLLSLIKVDVERKWPFADLSNDFFRKKVTGNVLNFPVATVTGLTS